MKTWFRIQAASLALMMIAHPGNGTCWAASPDAQPAEPEQLRGLPRPNELQLAQGPFQPTQASLDEHYRCPEWFADAKEMGGRLFLAMGVHCDNYDMWNSKYHRWNAVKIGPHKDIVALWQQAAMKQGLRFGVSEHLVPSYDCWNSNKMSDKTGPFAGVPYDGLDPANWDLYHPPHPGDQNMHAGFNAQDIAKDPEWWKHAWYRRVYVLITTYKPDFFDEACESSTSR